VDDIFCIFQGALGNIPLLNQQYGLGPYPIDKVVRDLSGKFAFVLFDSSSNFIFIAAACTLLVMILVTKNLSFENAFS
jgi:Aluminium induced protein